MDRSIHVKGELFDRISVFDDKIEVRKGDQSVTLLPGDIGCIECLKGGLCQDRTCRYHIDCVNLDNCTLNAHKPMSLGQISKIIHITKEGIRLAEEKAIKKGRKILKKNVGKAVGLRLDDFIDLYKERALREKRVGHNRANFERQ